MPGSIPAGRLRRVSARGDKRGASRTQRGRYDQALQTGADVAADAGPVGEQTPGDGRLAGDLGLVDEEKNDAHEADDERREHGRVVPGLAHARPREADERAGRAADDDDVAACDLRESREGRRMRTYIQSMRAKRSAMDACGTLRRRKKRQSKAEMAVKGRFRSTIRQYDECARAGRGC